MAVVGFLVLYSGVISSVIAAGSRAALLTFILPVMLPGDLSDLPMRLAGWGTAVAISVPVAVFVWPPHDQNVLRARAADMCRALGRMLTIEPRAPGEGDPLVAMSRANTALRAAFHASAYRPVALTTGSRLLMRLVDELEWLTTTVANACADAPETWPEKGRQLRAASASVVDACAVVLDDGDGGGPTIANCGRLNTALARLEQTRTAIADEAVVALRAASQVGAVADAHVTLSAAGDQVPGEFERPLYAAHELGYTVAMTGRTVTVIGAADSRTWLQRLLGRPPMLAAPIENVTEIGEAVAAERIAAGHLDRHSVWLQNSIRGAAGLAFAVLLARISGQREGFWIVLGALSVLRSNALTIGATVARVLLGTLIGFAIGALLVGAIGTNAAVLWPLLPIAVFVAGFAPDAISFAAGQAAFTVVVIILFNIIVPTGWRLGVLRIEDVALGCAASLVAGALFWPRGAGAALGIAIGESYRESARYLRESVDYVAGHRGMQPDKHGAVLDAGYRLDDAFRQYLAERGAKRVDLEDVAALTNGASRLRLAGEAVASLRRAFPDTAPEVPDADLEGPIQALKMRTTQVASWYSALGNVISGESTQLPSLEPDVREPSFLDVVLPAVDRCGDPDRAARAE
ncbi:MAG TPA: FUSC family protein, partial [Micromonosporaceae bacterium]